MKWMKVAGNPAGGKMAALGEALSGAMEEEAGTWGTKGKAREGNWRMMSEAVAGLAGLYHTQPTAAGQPPRSGTLESEGRTGREGGGARRCSRRGNAALRRDWLTADVRGCFPPSGRFPEINPPSPPPPPTPPSSSPPGPPRCRSAGRLARGGGSCCASSKTGRGSAWAPSSAEACPPSTRFCPDTKASRPCSRRSGRSRGPRTLNHRPGPGRSESSPGSALLSCCGNTCVDQPVVDKRKEQVEPRGFTSDLEARPHLT